MTDDWSRDMDRRLQAMRDNPEGYVRQAFAELREATPARRHTVSYPTLALASNHQTSLAGIIRPIGLCGCGFITHPAPRRKIHHLLRRHLIQVGLDHQEDQ